MLNKDEEDFLAQIPPEKVAHFQPFDPRAKQLGDRIASAIKTTFPEVTVVHIGSTGLGISGQGDIDIYVLVPKKKFPKFVPGISDLFGEPTKHAPTFIAWEFMRGNFEIALYLSDPNSQTMQEQLSVYHVLSGNPELLKEYEELKREMSGKPYRDYQRAKYEFYHKILSAK